MNKREAEERAARARWAHLPAGQERDRRIAETLRDIQRETFLIGLGLPMLDEDELDGLIHEAVADVLAQRGCPATSLEQALFDAHVDALLERLTAQAREAKAPAEVRALLIERRLQRMPGVRAYLGLGRTG